MNDNIELSRSQVAEILGMTAGGVAALHHTGKMSPTRDAVVNGHFMYFYNVEAIRAYLDGLIEPHADRIAALDKIVAEANKT